MAQGSAAPAARSSVAPSAGGTGAAIGSSTTKKEPEKVIVKERVVEREVSVVEVHDGPPGTAAARKRDGTNTRIECRAREVR